MEKGSSDGDVENLTGFTPRREDDPSEGRTLGRDTDTRPGLDTPGTEHDVDTATGRGHHSPVSLSQKS